MTGHNPSLGKYPSPRDVGSTRQPINIDPDVRDALRRHLMSPKYMGTGVGYSEFIRRAILADGGEAPDSVQPDNRWMGTYEPDDTMNSPRQEPPDDAT